MRQPLDCSDEGGEVEGRVDAVHRALLELSGISEHMHDAREVLLDVALEVDVGVDQTEQEADDGFEVVILQIAENHRADLLIVVVERQELDDALDVGSERLLVEVALKTGCGGIEDSCPPAHQQPGSIRTSFA